MVGNEIPIVSLGLSCRDKLQNGGGERPSSRAEEDGTRHVINDFIWEMSIRTISTKVEDVSHKNL